MVIHLPAFLSPAEHLRQQRYSKRNPVCLGGSSTKIKISYSSHHGLTTQALLVQMRAELADPAGMPSRGACRETFGGPGATGALKQVAHQYVRRQNTALYVGEITASEDYSGAKTLVFRRSHPMYPENGP